MNMEPLTTFDTAILYQQAGLEVIPDHPTAKYPLGIKGWETHNFTTDELRDHLDDRGWGIGVRNIEGIDIDNNPPPGAEHIFNSWAGLVTDQAPGLINRLLVETTPSGGYHIVWKCDVIEGNQKLAHRPPTPEELKKSRTAAPKVLIETRGSNGQFMVAPSKGYEVIQGEWVNLSTITPAEREILLDSARAFDRKQERETPAAPNGETRPGDRYNETGAAEALQLLQDAGWHVVFERNDITYLRRPGKNNGISATFGAVAPGIFYNFSSNGGPFESGTSYSPFAVLTTLKHSGDYKAAAKELAHRFGMNGTEPKQPPQPAIHPDLIPGSTWEDLAAVIGPIEWSWHQWLPKGFQTVVAGLSGDGKSNLVLHIAKCFLTGIAWPDGTPFTGETGDILWCETEAAQGLNWSRAEKWHLPTDRIRSPLSNPLEDINLDDPHHRAAIEANAHRPEVKLVVVDSLSGGTRKDSKQSSEMIALGKWIAELARDTGKPVIVTHHLRKRGLFDNDRVDLDRLRDSSAIVQTARMVWAIDAPDPDEKEHRRFYVIKSNLAKFPEDDIGFRVYDHALAFGDAPEPPRQESQLDRAKDLLLTFLANEPRAFHAIKAEAEAAAISINTMRTAKKKLGVNVVKNAAGWFWSLPPKEERA